MQLLGDRVLIKPIERDEKIGSIYINPAIASADKIAKYEVILVGPGLKNSPLVKPGDNILISKDSGIEITWEQKKGKKEDFKMIRDIDIYAII